MLSIPHGVADLTTHRGSVVVVANDLGIERTESNFAENVRLLRERAGISQTEFAKRLHEAGLTHFHQTTVSRLEKGERPIRLGEARVIASVLDERVNSLWSEPAETFHGREIAQHIRDLDERKSQLRLVLMRWATARELLKQACERLTEDGWQPDPDAPEGSLPELLARAGRHLQEEVREIVNQRMGELNGEHQEEA